MINTRHMHDMHTCTCWWLFVCAAGITLDVVLVTLICPRAILGGAAPATAGQSALQRWLAKVPAAALEASTKGE